MTRTCQRCGAPLHGRIDQKFCCDACRIDHHNEQRRLREKELRAVNRILSGNWRILSESIRSGKTRTSVAELAARNFNFQLYTATRRRVPGRRTYWCYNCEYSISRFGIVRIGESVCRNNAYLGRMKENRPNPLLEASPLPYGAPVFDRIEESDYLPAFEEAIARNRAEIEAIRDNPEPPGFANTIEALEWAGADLDRISGIFFNLTEACTDDNLDRIAEEVSPQLTRLGMSILQDGKLFARVKAVWERRSELSLDTEAAKLLEETWKSFSRHGADLPPDKKACFAQVSEELSLATLKFGQHVLADTNAFFLHLTDAQDLAGLPDFVRETAAAEAQGRGLPGWVFTLHQPSYGPFLKFSDRRELREKMWRAYNGKCLGGDNDNTEILRRIVSLRTEKARLLGYGSYAAYALEERMAKSPQAVATFLDRLMKPSLPAARREVAMVAEYAVSHGSDGELMPWDFAYWAEKYRKEKYALDDELLKPYFRLEAVQTAVFGTVGFWGFLMMLAALLFGLLSLGGLGLGLLLLI